MEDHSLQSSGHEPSSFTVPRLGIQPDLTSRLPDEILSEIFLHFRPDTASMQRCSDSAEAGTWWAIQRVSRRWRSVTLSTPRFWAIPIYTSHELLELMLARVRCAPLTINLHEAVLRPELDGARMLRTVLDHLEHTEQLILRVRADTLESFVTPDGALAQRAPILRMCSITCTDSHDTHLSPALPETIFGGQQGAPRLETLHLSNLVLSWTSPLFGASLRMLVLTGAPPPGADGPLQILSALARMPRLRNLILCRRRVNTTSALPPPPPPSGALVRLPELRQCMFMASLGDTCTLLHALALPVAADVGVNVDVFEGARPLTESIGALAAALSARYTTHASPRPADADADAEATTSLKDAAAAPLRSVRILASVYNDTFRLSAATVRQRDVFSAPGPPARAEPAALASSSLDVSVSGSLRSTSGAVPTSLGSMLRALPLRSVVELVVDFGMYTLRPEWWEDVARGMPALDTAVLYGHNAADTFFAMLAGDGRTHESQNQNRREDGPGALPLPTLRSLALVGLDLVYPTRCSELMRTLRLRSRAGARMHRMCLRACALPRKRVLEIQAHVRELVMLLDELDTVGSEYTQADGWFVEARDLIV